MDISDGDLRGLTVIGADGNAIGDVAALILDTNTWTVKTLRVRLRGGVAEQVGVGHSFFHGSTIDVPVGRVQSVGDTLVLSVAASGLREDQPGGTSAAAHV
jgi:sporulation protein YlmC with PRC-barrel domain